MSEINPGEVRVLVRRLVDLNVDLPDDVVTAVDQMGRFDLLRRRPVPPPKVLGLTDDELATALSELELGCSVAGARDALREAHQAMSQAMAAAVVAALEPRADEILDQLRPAFDDAAATVHRATELGIHPGSTDRDVLEAEDVQAARDAWAALPAAARKLTAIAAVRIGLTTAVGAPPAAYVPDGHYRHPESVADLARCMFRTDGRGWRADFEEDWQLWLRLCAGTPARLLTLAESARAARGIAA